MLVKLQDDQCQIKDLRKGYAVVASGTYDKGLYKLDAQPHVQHALLRLMHLHDKGLYKLDA